MQIGTLKKAESIVNLIRQGTQPIKRSFLLQIADTMETLALENPCIKSSSWVNIEDKLPSNNWETTVLIYDGMSYEVLIEAVARQHCIQDLITCGEYRVRHWMQLGNAEHKVEPYYGKSRGYNDILTKELAVEVITETIRQMPTQADELKLWLGSHNLKLTRCWEVLGSENIKT